MTVRPDSPWERQANGSHARWRSGLRISVKAITPNDAVWWIEGHEHDADDDGRDVGRGNTGQGTDAAKRDAEKAADAFAEAQKGGGRVSAPAPSYSGWAKQDPIRFTCSVCGALPGALCTVEQHGKRVPVSAMPHIQRIVDAEKAGGR